MLTGGSMTRDQAFDALNRGIDVVVLARTLVIDPALPKVWQPEAGGPHFPRFQNPSDGGVTAWYTTCLEH